MSDIRRSDDPNLAAASAALARGQAHLAAQEGREAIAWLDRACRLAPEDVHAALLLATAQVGSDPGTAEANFRRILAREELREARLGLALLALQRGEAATAAAELAALLAAHAPARSTDFTALADGIAGAVAAPGWAGCDSAGRVVVHLRRAAPPPAGRLGARNLVFRPAPARGLDCWTATLPPDAVGPLVVEAGAPLLGSPLDPARIRRLEGCVEAAADGLQGWAWHPADPDAAPRLRIVGGGACLDLQATELHDAPLPPGVQAAPRRRFALAREDVPGAGPVEVTSLDGTPLFGSPLHPDGPTRAAAGAVRRLMEPGVPSSACDAWRPLPARLPVPARPPVAAAPHRPVDIVLPIYRGAADLAACLASLRGTLPEDSRIVLVEDGSPDPDLVALAEAAAARGEAILLRHGRNRGFPAAVNTGLRHADGRDVVLLNADTLLPHGWLGRLRAAAYARPDTGSATPFTNEGTILSYPDPGGDNPVPDLAMTAALDAYARRANGGQAPVEIPTGIGFCLYLRRDCLDEVGPLREDAFAQGYGEENDWCMRARRLGWRHVAATDLFVGHVGGRSFGAARLHLAARNGRIMEALHPGYDALIQEFLAADPLAPARRRMDTLRWTEGRRPEGAIVLVLHGRGGGVARHVAERAASLRALGLRPVLLRPALAARDRTEACRVSDGPEDAFPGLRFALPEEFDALVALLAAERVRRVEIHHRLGHPPRLDTFAARLGVPLHVVVHDYALICPRISLLGPAGRHCGEPPAADCAACVADLGAEGDEPDVPALRRTSAALLAAAARVVTPAEDVAARLRRHFGALPQLQVVPWEVAPRTVPATPQPAGSGPRTVAVLGAIGLEKGYDLLLGCARDAARRDLPLRFVLIGHSCDDRRLLATGTAFVTGRYAEHEVPALLRFHAPRLGFVPSVVPETWCYALSALLQAGLPVAALDLGAQAERLRRWPGAPPLLLPPAATAAEANAALLAWPAAAARPAIHREPVHA